MRWLIPGLVLLTLAACHVPTPAEISANDDATCRSYGLSLGSPGYADCRQNLVARRDELRRERARQLNFQQEMQVQSSQQFMRAINGNTVNCYSQPFGFGYQTNCR